MQVWTDCYSLWRSWSQSLFSCRLFRLRVQFSASNRAALRLPSPSHQTGSENEKQHNCYLPDDVCVLVHSHLKFVTRLPFFSKGWIGIAIAKMGTQLILGSNGNCVINLRCELTPTTTTQRDPSGKRWIMFNVLSTYKFSLFIRK